MRLVVLCLFVTAVAASPGDHHGKGDGKSNGKGGMMGGMGDGKGGMMGGKSMDHGPQCVCNITTPAETRPFKMSLKNATCGEAGAKCQTMCKTLMEKLKNGTMFKPLPMGPRRMYRWGAPKMDYRKICCMNAPSHSVSATVKYKIKSSSCQKDFTDVPGSVMFNCKNVTCGNMKGKVGMDDKGKEKDMDRLGGPKGKDPIGLMDPLCVCNVITPAGPHGKPNPIPGATCDNIEAMCEEKCKGFLEKLKQIAEKAPKMMDKDGKKGKHRPIDRYWESQKGKDGKGKVGEEQNYTQICCMNHSTTPVQYEEQSRQMKMHRLKGKYLHTKLCCMNQASRSVSASVTSWVDGDGCSEDATALPGSTSINCTMVNCSRMDNMKERLEQMKKGKWPKRPKESYGRQGKGMDTQGKGKEEDMDPLCICNMTTSMGTKAIPHRIPELTCDDDLRVKCSEVCRGLLEKLRGMKTLLPIHGPVDHHEKEQDKGKGKGMDKEMSDKEQHKKICCDHKSTTTVSAAINFWVKSQTCGIDTATNLGTANIDCREMKCDARPEGPKQEDMDPLCICNMTTSMGTKAMLHPIPELTCDNDVRGKCSEVCMGLLEKLRGMKTLLPIGYAGPGDHHGEEEDKGKGKGMDKEMSDKEQHKKICCDHKSTTSVSAAINFWVRSQTCGIDTATNLGTADIDCMGMKCDARPNGPKEEDMDPLCVCNMTTSLGTKAMLHPIRELTCDDDVRAKCSQVCMGLLEKLRGMKTLLPIRGTRDHHGKEQDNGKGRGMDKEMSDMEQHKKICCDHKSTTSVSAAINYWVKSQTCGIDIATDLGTANIDCRGMKCDARPEDPKQEYMDPLCVCNMTTSMGTKAVLHPIPELTCDNDVRAKCSEVCMGLLEKLRGMKILLTIGFKGPGDHHGEEEDKGKGKGMDKEMSDKEQHKKICCDHKSTTSVSVSSYMIISP